MPAATSISSNIAQRKERAVKILKAFRSSMHQDVALDYLCGEGFFPFLMRAKTDPEVAAHVPEFKEAISRIVGSGVGGLKDYLRSRSATYWAARATNPDMGRGHRARAAQLLEEATRILLYHEKLDRAALPPASPSSVSWVARKKPKTMVS
jgi:hypothetical protein